MFCNKAVRVTIGYLILCSLIDPLDNLHKFIENRVLISGITGRLWRKRLALDSMIGRCPFRVDTSAYTNFANASRHLSSGLALKNIMPYVSKELACLSKDFDKCCLRPHMSCLAHSANIAVRTNILRCDACTRC